MKWFKKNNTDVYRDKILKEDLGLGNIIASSFNAKKLYDELKVICHPDRYLDTQKNSIATELSQLVSRHQFDYPILLELKGRIANELTE